MSLKFVKIDTFAAHVPVCLSSDDPAKPNEGSFVATFKHFGRDAFNALIDEQLSDRELLERTLIRVEGIGDGEGNTLPAEQQRALVLDELALGAAAVKAFVEGLAGAGRKNAKPSRGR